MSTTIITIECSIHDLIQDITGGGAKAVTDKLESAWFTVPYEWLEKKVASLPNKYNSVEEFLGEYTFDQIEGWLQHALEEGVLLGTGTGIFNKDFEEQLFPSVEDKKTPDQGKTQAGLIIVYKSCYQSDLQTIEVPAHISLEVEGLKWFKESYPEKSHSSEFITIGKKLNITKQQKLFMQLKKVMSELSEVLQDSSCESNPDELNVFHTGLGEAPRGGTA